MQIPEIRVSNGENREAKKQRNINITLSGAGSMQMTDSGPETQDEPVPFEMRLVGVSDRDC